MKTNVFNKVLIYILLLHTSVAFHFPNPGIDDQTSHSGMYTISRYYSKEISIISSNLGLWNIINPNILNLGIWYRIVSTSSFCGHVLGGKPYHCLKNTEPDCQKQCTLSEWCIGYARRHHSCALMTSSGVCPSGWEKMSGNVARSEGDLVATYNDDWVCKSKKGTKLMKWLKYYFVLIDHFTQLLDQFICYFQELLASARILLPWKDMVTV